jgi:AcrR family transcriptional regulator
MEGVGLRERSKARRRTAIIKAAFRLFADQGFDATTVAEIAREAEVAPRTVALYFPTKLDIALSRTNDRSDELVKALGNRSAGESPVHVIGDWLRARAAATDPDGVRALSRRMFAANPDLRALRATRIARIVAATKRALADDLGVDEHDARARVAASATGAVMLELSDDPTSLDDVDAIAAGVEFIEAGLEALRHSR